MFVLIYGVFIYFYVNVDADRRNERYPYQTSTFNDNEPRGSWANAVAHSSSGSAVSSANSGRSAVRPSEPAPIPCGSAAIPIAPVARFPFRAGVRSGASATSGSAVSSANAFGSTRANAFASYNPMELRRDCHESAWPNPDSGHYHCNDDRNATYKTCPNPCPLTCTYPQSVYPCYAKCLPHGCECNPGFVLSDEGRCILYRDCPGVLCNGDRNATYKQCPDPCPSTCALLGITRICDKKCIPYGCECNEGYHFNDDWKCIKIQDCPGALCNGDRNATLKRCPNPCPRTCDLPSGPGACIAMCPPRGCECNEGFYLNDKGKCVQLQDCPGAKCCTANETFVYCKAGCPTDYCPVDDSRAIVACSPPFPCHSGCVCKGDYLKLSYEDETCILATECPPINCTQPHEVWSKCPSACFNERCSDIGKEYSCNTRRHYCRPKCVCKPGFCRNDSDTCVPIVNSGALCNGDCNATFKECPNPCPRTCELPSGPEACIAVCAPRGCECNEGYVLNDQGKCVQLQDCPGALCNGHRNATFKECPNPCPKTCELPSGPEACIAVCAPRGCECNEGYYLNDQGKCVQLQDCPGAVCNGDRNATFKECPNPCPRTCELPRGPEACIAVCAPRGCECKEGYYLNDKGKCVQLQDCPGAKCASANETFVYCKAGCPTDYCPDDDSRAIVACSPPFPCPSGCVCKGDYLKLSSEDQTCILATECPSINCTRLNEVWSKCPPACFNERCSDIGRKSTCDARYHYCRPKCVCKPEFCRNESDICVPIPSTEPECDVCEECRPTCSNPTPKNCSTVIEIPMENVDGCKCKMGYILSDVKGKCIEIGNCPDGCNDDPNAVVTACPWPCPSTCDSPNASSCGRKCKTVGCQCKPGFILSENKGKCVLPDDCENGNPCGVNGTYSECSFRCPNQNCPEDDSRSIFACKPGRPCPPGCMCKEYYKRKSNEDDTCVLARDCPEITCTRPNEVFDPCASECLAENCIDLQTNNTCVPDPKNCLPKCVCCEGYYRDEFGDCVPKDQCPKQCDVPQECRPTCAVPNPPNCEYIQPSETNNECNCQSGYILDVSGGTCVRIGECPTNQTCNGDPNASIKECPQPCPSTCSSPNATPCKKKCLPVGCECNAGYILSGDGVCILPDQCEGGNPCGPNATFSPCRYNCPTNYCPKDDSRAVVVCETSPFAPCYSGCMCKLNHRRLSVEDPRCILSSECPPVNCTRPNEEWDPCPSDCLSEYCEDVDKLPVVCNTLVLNCNPKCICNKSYFRNSSDFCVTKAECCKLNEEKKNID